MASDLSDDDKARLVGANLRRLLGLGPSTPAGSTPAG
jgi:hypothetical protein